MCNINYFAFNTRQINTTIPTQWQYLEQLFLCYRQIRRYKALEMQVIVMSGFKKFSSDAIKMSGCTSTLPFPRMSVLAAYTRWLRQMEHGRNKSFQGLWTQERSLMFCKEQSVQMDTVSELRALALKSYQPESGPQLWPLPALNLSHTRYHLSKFEFCSFRNWGS